MHALLRLFANASRMIFADLDGMSCASSCEFENGEVRQDDSSCRAERAWYSKACMQSQPSLQTSLIIGCKARPAVGQRRMAWLLSQAAHLLCAVIYHLAALVFVHAPYIVALRTWHYFVQPRVPADWAGATFWEGVVKHARLKPVVHTFRCGAQAHRLRTCLTLTCFDAYANRRTQVRFVELQVA